MKKTFKCSCRAHSLEIEYKQDKDKISEIWMGIYNIYNPKTGRKYKKPKLIGDVWFLDCHNYAKEMNFLMKFLEDIVMAYTIRRK